jgi:hypothetical protein
VTTITADFGHAHCAISASVSAQPRRSADDQPPS